jgi:acetyl/propionyl-CoA carboxylase alpha subunit
VVQACIQDADAAMAACDAIGYPIMLKASWGGGGKGIRKVIFLRLLVWLVGWFLTTLQLM